MRTAGRTDTHGDPQCHPQLKLRSRTRAWQDGLPPERRSAATTRFGGSATRRPQAEHGGGGQHLPSLSSHLHASSSVSASALIKSVTSTSGGVVTKETYAPNGFGEPGTYAAAAGTSPLLSFAYLRDGLGRITTKTEQLLGGPASTTGYEYDEAGRLHRVLANINGSQVPTATYTYDDNGNRLTRVGGGVTETASGYDVQDRIGTYEYSDGRKLTFGYSANGEVTSIADADGAVTRFTYDARGNLREVVLAPSGDTITYLVDPQGRRVGKLFNGKLERAWLYEDQLRIAAELVYAPSGAVAHTKRFVYASRTNVPDLMIVDGARYRILSDHLGSPRLIVDAAGAVAERIDYDEYGRRTVVSPAVANDNDDGLVFSVPFGFAGGLTDRDTGFVRFGARDYDPVAGRWTSKDPTLLGGGGTNFYAYVDGDPVNQVDPAGTDSIPWQVIGEGIATGAIAGYAAILAGGAFALAATICEAKTASNECSRKGINCGGDAYRKKRECAPSVFYFLRSPTTSKPTKICTYKCNDGSQETKDVGALINPCPPW